MIGENPDALSAASGALPTTASGGAPFARRLASSAGAAVRYDRTGDEITLDEVGRIAI
jgi:hypothetical protein